MTVLRTVRADDDQGASRAAKESHHLHQGTRRVPSRRRDSNKSGVNDSPVDCQSRRRPRCVEHREGIPSSPPRGPEGPEQKKGFEQVGSEGQSCGLSEPTRRGCVEHREGIPSSPKGTEVPKRREAACGRAGRLSEERAAELRGASGGTEKDLGS